MGVWQHNSRILRCLHLSHRTGGSSRRGDLCFFNTSFRMAIFVDKNVLHKKTEHRSDARSPVVLAHFVRLYKVKIASLATGRLKRPWPSA